MPACSVPQGFTISTEACTQYYNDGRQINEGIMADIYEYIGKMEEIVGKKFGDPANPCWFPVRSGARAFHARYDGYHPQPGPERRSC